MGKNSGSALRYESGNDSGKISSSDLGKEPGTISGKNLGKRSGEELPDRVKTRVRRPSTTKT
jgi:hypothetical protein